MKVAIMQPTFLPYYGYFKLMKEVDRFIFLDNVQFSKQSWQQRNKVQVDGKEVWLTVPVHQRLGQMIKDVKIGHMDNLYKIQSTCRQHFNCNIDVDYKYLIDITIANINLIKDYLTITTETMFASLIGESDIVKLCETVGATEYISTGGSREYFDDSLENDFLTKGIDIKFNDYEPDYSIIQYLNDEEYLKGKGLV